MGDLPPLPFADLIGAELLEATPERVVARLEDRAR
jgi:hypothetical protein